MKEIHVTTIYEKNIACRLFPNRAKPTPCGMQVEVIPLSYHDRAKYLSVHLGTDGNPYHSHKLSIVYLPRDIPFDVNQLLINTQDSVLMSLACTMLAEVVKKQEGTTPNEYAFKRTNYTTNTAHFDTLKKYFDKKRPKR